MTIEKDKKLAKENLNQALGESIDNLGEVAKQSSRKILDALVEQGAQAVSDIFDKYKTIAKQKVINNGKNNKPKADNDGE